MNHVDRLRVQPGSKVRLADIDAGFTGHHALVHDIRREYHAAENKE